jgi:hypothetical protein
MKRTPTTKMRRYRAALCTAAGAFARLSGTLVADRRGAVAFETLIVYLFMMTSLLLPLADVAKAGFQFISAWAALRSYGQYAQYYPVLDATHSSSWPPSKTVSGYLITNIKVVCGDASTSPCSNGALTPKYYSYSTTVTLSPILLTAVLCPTSCTYTLPYSERFQ